MAVVDMPNNEMRIKITRLRSGVELPRYQTDHAAAMDLSAAIDEPISLPPHGRAVIPTGFALGLPEGYEAQIRARSGLSSKFGITMANGVGTIDADYRGEIGVIALNTSTEPFEVTPGMRIAQMVIAPVLRVSWDEVDGLGETDRGKGGYGSTGH